jgi:hypothetical protein
MFNPFGKIRRRLEWFTNPGEAPITKLGETPPGTVQVIRAKVKSAPPISSIRFAAANIGKPAINLPPATGKIACSRDAITDIPLPSFIESHGPSH